MKVLMLGWDLPPYTAGGLGQACHLMAESLVRKNMDLTFVVLEDNNDYVGHEFMQILPATNVTVDNIHEVSPYKSSYWMALTADGKNKPIGTMADLVAMYTEGVVKMARDGCFDDIEIIHAHDWLTAQAAISLKEMLGVPFAFHVHATEFDRSAGKYGNGHVGSIEYRAIHEADIIFPVSHYTGGILVQHYDADPSKIRVAHNGPSHSLVERVNNEKDYRNAVSYLHMLKERGNDILLVLSRFTIQKNLYNLFVALKQSLETNPNLLLVIGGSGEQREELMELAAELGITENIFWAGFVRGDFKHKLYELSTLFLMPSSSEPFGLTPFEALEANTMSIISKTSGVGEVIPSFVAVDAWDVDRLAHEIVDLVGNDYRRNDLLSRAQEEYRAHSWDNTSDGIIEGYRKVVE